jgi:hypothetical protein
MSEEDKAALTCRRAELVTSLAGTLAVEDRVRIQEELSVINAKIKGLNTTQAAQLKATANQRKIMGLAEAQANAARATAKITTGAADGSEDEDEDPSAIDAWIDAVLLRHDVDFTRSRAGKISFKNAPEEVEVLEVLIAGLYAASRGQELPELPSEAPKPKKASKPKRP